MPSGGGIHAINKAGHDIYKNNTFSAKDRSPQYLSQY